MKKQSSAITVGLDLGDRKHAGCVLDAKGEILKELGHRVLVANPRKVRVIDQNERKSEGKDAGMLVRLGRSDE